MHKDVIGITNPCSLKLLQASMTTQRLSTKTPAPKTPENAFAFPQSKRQRQNKDSARAFHKKQATNLVDALSETMPPAASLLPDLKIPEPENIANVKVGRAVAKSQAHRKETEDVYTTILQTMNLTDLYAVITTSPFEKLASDHATITSDEWKTLVESVPIEVRKATGLPEDTTDYTVDESKSKEEAKKITATLQQCKDAWIKNLSRIVPHTGESTIKNYTIIFLSS